jgi:hypothetical protein
MGNPAGVRRNQKQKRTKRDLKRMIAKLTKEQDDAAKKAPTK